jgi:hypothetical protein
MSDKAGVLDSYHLGEVLKPSARKLGERCGAAAVDMLAQRLTEYLGSVEDDKYSYIWRSAIEDHEQDAHKEDTRAVLVDALRDAALGATIISSPEAQAVANSLLKSPYLTLTRVGIYVCGEHYGSVGTAFWACAKENWFIDVSYWHELYWFIKKAFVKFSAAERSQFLNFVDRLKGDWSDESLQEEFDETQRRDLLHPAFGLGDSEVNEKYQALIERLGPVRDHPDFHTYTASGLVVDRGPVASDALVGMSDEELVDFLKSFVPEGRGWDGPTFRGVALSISAAVKASEDGFARRIGLFADLARPYQHGLLRGLKERWSEDKRDINWPATLSLLQAIVSSAAFKADLEADQGEGGEPTVRWVVSDIADLLKAASGTERHLPTKLYKSCLEVLRLVLEATTSTEADQSTDAVSHAINSHRGRALESFIHLALAMRREEVAAEQDSSENWAIVGPVFDVEVASSESGLNADFAAIAAMYCANLHYINSQWTEANFDRLFSTSNEAAWRCAAQGFAYQRYLYDWLFIRLVSGDHLRRMIYSEGLPDQVAEKALQFLGLAYLEDMESLDGGGLLSELVAGLRVKELSQLCWFFWTLRGSGEPSHRTSKILAFWLKVAEQVRASRKVMPELQSALSKLAVFVQELTPAVVDALVEAAPHANVRYNGYMIIKNLARLVSQYPKEVDVIFRAAMSGFLPDHKKEDVIRCVTGLAEAGEVEKAEWICNAYAERGSMLLKETYERLRAQQRSPTETGHFNT